MSGQGSIRILKNNVEYSLTQEDSPEDTFTIRARLYDKRYSKWYDAETKIVDDSLLFLMIDQLFDFIKEKEDEQNNIS